MPKSQVRDIDDYEGWARRMIDEVRDFDHAGTKADFVDFVDRTAIGSSLSDKTTLRNAQLRGIAKGQAGLAEFREQIGVTQTIDKQTFTYKTGRLAGREVTRKQIHFRDERGVFISRQAMKNRIEEVRAALEPEKRRRDE